MDSKSQGPKPPFRTVSATSLGSSNSITRVASGPINAVGGQLKKKAQSEQLYKQCQSICTRMSIIEGMEPFLKQAEEMAEHCAEQQALALSQTQKMVGGNGDVEGFRSSLGSGEFFVPSSASSEMADHAQAERSVQVYTFTAGVLPANMNTDPVTLLSKLCQQGASLCLLFNYVISDYEIPIIASDDLRVCKKSIYDFLIAIKTHLNFEDESIFTISDVFSDSTHDLIKVVKIISRLMNMTRKISSESDSDNLALSNLTISDDRSKVFRELIETERSYMLDLEFLLAYKKELQTADLISNEQIDIIFPNLNDIIDFQRRLLIGLECNASVDSKYQRLGSLFVHASKGPFKAYEPWTVGQLAAISLINKESASLRKSSSLIDPGFELQSYILKPIQRLCKYPLLINEIIKSTPNSDTSDPRMDLQLNELRMAHIAMKEVANGVNEAQRRSENVGFVQELNERVSDWRGFSLKDQGDLLYHGLVAVRDSDFEKEYVAYLFEKILFFFIDRATQNSKDRESKKVRDLLGTRKKSSSYSSSSLADSFNSAREKSTYDLKGRVYISEIYNIQAIKNNSLTISWSGKKENGSFSLRYRTEEVRNHWEVCLRNLKAKEISTIINKKSRNSQSSRSSTDSLTDLTGAYGNSSPLTYQTNGHYDSYSRSSSGSSQRHHSSSSTFSMMKQSRTKSEVGNSRTSSSSLGYNTNSTQSDKAPGATHSISINLIYNKVDIPDKLIIPFNTSFNEVRSKISTTIASSKKINDDILVNRLRYKDEDGDFVVMDSPDDWNLAIDMLYEYESSEPDGSKILSIWVS